MRFVDSRVYPQTLDVIKTRAKYFGWDVVVGDFEIAKNGNFFGALFQYVGREGDAVDLTDIISQVKANGAQAIVAADVMSLVLLKSPGQMGADIALGNTQRFGVPMGFGTLMPLIFALKSMLNARHQVVLLACQLMPKVNKPRVWHYKRASSISAVKKPIQIFVPHKYCWQIWQVCMPFIMVPKG